MPHKCPCCIQICLQQVTYLDNSLDKGLNLVGRRTKLAIADCSQSSKKMLQLLRHFSKEPRRAATRGSSYEPKRFNNMAKLASMWYLCHAWFSPQQATCKVKLFIPSHAGCIILQHCRNLTLAYPGVPNHDDKLNSVCASDFGEAKKCGPKFARQACVKHQVREKCAAPEREPPWHVA